MIDSATSPRRPDARAKLLDAAQRLIRERGFAATTVDDLCAVAGVTKGAFFHHFRSKEDLGVKAAEHWSTWTTDLFASAPFHAPDDPVDRILAYVDFRTALIDGTTADYTCLLGTMIQELHETSPAIRDAAFAAVARHAATLEEDFAAAIARHGAPEGVTAQSLALHTQAVIQGAFVIAKGSGDAAAARASLAHLRRYVALLFGRPAADAPTTQDTTP